MRERNDRSTGESATVTLSLKCSRLDEGWIKIQAARRGLTVSQFLLAGARREVERDLTHDELIRDGIRIAVEAARP